MKFSFWTPGYNQPRWLVDHQTSQETFICEVEVLKSEMTSCEVTVEGEFVSEATMQDEWGWSEPIDLINNIYIFLRVLS